MLKVHYVTLSLCAVLSIIVLALSIYHPKQQIVFKNFSGDVLKNIAISTDRTPLFSLSQISNSESKLNQVYLPTGSNKLNLHFFADPDYSVDWDFYIDKKASCFEITVDERLMPRLDASNDCNLSKKSDINI